MIRVPADGTRAKYLAGATHFLCWLGDVDPASATRQGVDSEESSREL